MGKRTGYRKPKSARELRRKQNKEDIRYLYEMEISPIARQKEALYKNGITAEDLKKEYEKGAKAGNEFGEQYSFKVIYAAFLITMIDHHGMDQDEAVKLLMEIDDQVVLCVASEDLIEEAYEKTGIALNWKDPLERIQSK